MTCNVCRLNKKLYLYTKDNLIYALCLLCLKTQEQIDVAKDYQNLLEQIDKGYIAKEDLE